VKHSVLALSMVFAAVLQAVAQNPSPHPADSVIDLYAHTFENRVYTNPALGITVTYPEEWTFLDTQLLREKDAEAAKQSKEALIARLGPNGAQLVNSGVVRVAEVANVVVARKGTAASGLATGSIYLKTTAGGVSFVGPSGYFQENDFFMGKEVKFLKGPQDITINGIKLSQADIRIKQAAGKPLFARVDVALLENPEGGLCRYVIFQFVENSIEEAQRDSEMLQSLQLSQPKPALFPASKRSQQ
jgi:hypothetical protein